MKGDRSTLHSFFSEKNTREIEKQILDKILGIGIYDNKIRPSGANGTGEYFHFLFKMATGKNGGRILFLQGSDLSNFQNSDDVGFIC